MRRYPYRYLSVLAALALLAGCSATASIKNARESFDRTKAAGAESKAPYEYYMSENYLKQAEHEAVEGDQAEAKVFAAESEKYSAEALGKTVGGVK